MNAVERFVRREQIEDLAYRSGLVKRMRPDGGFREGQRAFEPAARATHS